MEFKFLRTLLNSYKFKRIKKDDCNYDFYIKQIKELKNKNIESYNFKDIKNVFKSFKWFDITKNILSLIDESIIYKSYKHGKYHNERVLLYTLILAHLLDIDSEDLKIAIYGAMYHDIGRENDTKDDNHGKKSAEKLASLNLDISEEALNILKTIVACHSIPSDDLEENCKIYNVKEYERCKKLFGILRDADVLDRTRLGYPYIKLELLKNQYSAKLVKLAYEIYYNFKLVIGDPRIELKKCLKYNRQKFRLNFKVRRIVDKQIKRYFEIEQSKFKLDNHSYKVGDSVVLKKHNYLHGIGKNNNALEFVSVNGIVGRDCATGSKGTHAFNYVSGFWRVEKEISLKEYITNYSGMDVTYEKEWELVPYGKLDDFVEKMKTTDHFKWEAESSMEIRFMPSIVRDINQYGFILNVSSSEAQSLIENDINGKNFDRNISKYFASVFDSKRNKNKHSTGSYLNRASYIIFGMNRCFIEGVLVGRKVEKDEVLLKELKRKFPDCYICNLDGKIIRE